MGIKRIIKEISAKKPLRNTQIGDLPFKVISENIDLFSFRLPPIFNFHLDKGAFPKAIK